MIVTPPQGGVGMYENEVPFTACVFEGMMAQGIENRAMDRRDTPSREDGKAIRQ